MAFSRRLGVIGLVSISWFVAVACSDDGGKKAEHGSDGGEGGEGPSGGKPNSAGSSNTAGKGGAAAAGKGGMSTGGNGGTAAGGTGVDGGAGAGPGGENAGGAGVGGASGGAGGASGGAAGSDSAGAGGVPAAVAKGCANECEVDADCTLPNAGPQKCDPVSHRCYDAAPVECSTHDECVPGGSGWLTICDGASDCAGNGTESCVKVGPLGYCALLPVEGTCDFGLDVTRMIPFGGDGEVKVAVCANTYSRCRTGRCDILNCADPLFGGFCGSGAGDSCNAESGLCECTAGTECKSGVCGADKQCAQCAVDEHCKGGGAFSGYDTCVNGSCGCSSATICPDLTASGVPVCE